MRRVANQGFTMVELMVALSVAGILLTVALPSYQVFVQDTRLLTQSNHFTSAVMLTKGEAVKRGRSATICPSTDGVACTGGTNWSNGWIVFADEDGDGVVDTGEEVIQVGAPLTGDNQLISGVRTRVTFAASGFSLGFNDTFSLCDSRGATYSKVLIINNQGRLRAETGTGVCS
ncbi:type IV fimbrial biogenesis protein FimT [Nitrosomonas cryotolerans]|uniref:Type II secretion system protein H n=1 Tax=Nitrosomonas cryotolerans ATCC 49181 TaxID=1131553 RepID=A0A1N6FJT5_9PROT|nr:GspH/FimT family pseudopilin [Nitrosomonas cryotolerans]SFP82002.1 type IV fimbrial biogenesis protein FimT [Nitrosomonas cryotolerans]SIN95504.1 type IV fimbrial biogenesis protein FimT [Nitrosomonas cryotolerans ATCC 49181]